MATHSRILPWKIPWTEEPEGLQSMGWPRVGHNWVTKHTQTQTAGRAFFSGSVCEMPRDWILNLDWLKKIALIYAGKHHPICWGPERNQKTVKAQIHSLLELGHLSSPPFITAPGPQAFRLRAELTVSMPPVLRPSDVAWIAPLTSLALLITDGRL